MSPHEAAVPDYPCTVSGYSDDLIEVEGTISEEFPLPRDDKALLAFSTGVVLSVEFGEDGLWRIRPVHGAAHVTVVHEDDQDDLAHLADAPAWVVLGTQMAKA